MCYLCIFTCLEIDILHIKLFHVFIFVVFLFSLIRSFPSSYLSQYLHSSSWDEWLCVQYISAETKLLFLFGKEKFGRFIGLAEERSKLEKAQKRNIIALIVMQALDNNISK